MFSNIRRKQKSEAKYMGLTGLSSYTITKYIDKNEEMIHAIFRDDSTLRTRHFQSKNSDLKGFIVFIEGLADTDMIAENIIKPLTNAETDKSKVIDQIRLSIINISDIREAVNVTDFVRAILAGYTVLFIEGEDRVLILSAKGFKGRSIEEPEGERVLRGPKEGFTETLSENISMIRRKIISNDLKIVEREIGRRTNTKVAIMYLEGLAKKEILQELYSRLDKIDIGGLIDTNKINELIKDNTLSAFKTIGVTERPDSVTSKLLEGRIAVLIEGSPNVLTLPYLFIENFQTCDDYYINYVYSSFNRFIRLTGFILTTLTTSIYLSLVAFHREIIPVDLALSIAQARDGVPLPTIVEIFFLLLIFELIRETSLRTHSNVVQSISIVGALVIGQAVVEAKFVSAPVVIIVAIAAITELINPKIKGAAILIRIVFLLAASFLGLFGVLLMFIVVISHLFSLKSFGINYMSQVYSMRLQEYKDFFIRAPWSKQKTRPKLISQDEILMNDEGRN